MGHWESQWAIGNSNEPLGIPLKLAISQWPPVSNEPTPPPVAVPLCEGSRDRGIELKRSMSSSTAQYQGIEGWTDRGVKGVEGSSSISRAGRIEGSRSNAPYRALELNIEPSSSMSSRGVQYRAFEGSSSISSYRAHYRGIELNINRSSSMSSCRVQYRAQYRAVELNRSMLRDVRNQRNPIVEDSAPQNIHSVSCPGTSNPPYKVSLDLIVDGMRPT